MNRPKEILVVEDDDIFRLLVVRVAGEYDCHVMQASTVEEGMRCLRYMGDKLDAVSLDLKLEDGSGLRLFSELRRVSPRIPVAIFSGYITDEVVKQVESVGVAFFIRKDNGSTMGRIRALLDYLGIPKREMAVA